MSQKNPESKPFPGKKPSGVIAPGTLDVKKELESTKPPAPAVVEIPAEGVVLPDSQPNEKVTFLSFHRSPMFFYDPLLPTKYIRFNQCMYSTSDPYEVKWLRESSQLGEEYWEKEYPAWVIEKKKKDKEFISLVNEEESSESK